MAKTLYSYESNISAPAADLFAYYERPAAIQRLTPPWESARIVEKVGGIGDKGTVKLEIKLGLFRTHWVAKHGGYIKNSQFVDTQIQGPFKYWKHTHSFRSVSALATTLKDTIQFELPFGSVGHQLGYGPLREKLNRMFTYRHSTTSNDVSHWLLYKDQPRCKVAITGGNGLVGSELAVFLMSQGHDVLILSRSGKSRVLGATGVRWDPAENYIDGTMLAHVDCWIHLAGENISKGRWTDNRILKLWKSRVEVTRFLVDYLKSLDNPPRTFVCASGVGFYGSGSAEVNESSSKGRGILANICEGWENASQSLEETGIRRVILRSGVVLSKKEGALKKMLPVFKLGLGGPIGSGTQYLSWIAMDDLLRILDTAILDPSVEGVFNAVSPQPVTNQWFTRALANVLNRPAFLPVPACVLKPALGRMAEETLLASQNVTPMRLLERKFRFDFPEIEIALSHCLGVY